MTEKNDQIEAAASTVEADPWAEAMAEQEAMAKKQAEASPAPLTDVLETFDGTSADSSNEKISFKLAEFDLVRDIPVQITVELGRARLPIKKLLSMGHGSVIELEGLAGEPMDVKVNGTLVARGEVVVINEKFGVRLTDIVNQQTRIQGAS